MSKIRDDLKAIYTAAIAAVDPVAAVDAHLTRKDDALRLFNGGHIYKEYRLGDYSRVLVVGAGKATAAMARAVETLLGDRVDTGLICVKYGYTDRLERIKIIEAAHPVPDSSGVDGAKKIVELLNSAGSDDLVISLISGGGSALLPLPPDPISLEDKRETTSLLLKCGASIHEVNTVRKHLSLVKGGNMAKAAGGATVINLMISDVVGDNMDVIASGPFVPDRSTFRDAWNVFEKYGLSEKVPPTVAGRIRAGCRGDIEENPGPDDPVFAKVTNLIVASNIIALQAARNEAVSRGYNSIILSSMIEGDTGDTAAWHARIAREILASSNPVPAPACVISGGETTVIVTGDGLGGRNMEYAMHAAVHIEGLERVTMASIGTDGSDGPTDAAGACADGGTLKEARERGMDIRHYIDTNDSYHFHERLGTLIRTGPTNTNTMDVRILLIS
ncbi:MAG TPA: glycerate kinase [Spirochaetota bacterium]|nr:glycerate kinase [Spirochaetota bacterium]HQF08738.1 glycerate kinase [Spirochaetota bacterium]HQH97561.1 glycerate kinase [Spirochaetota bacterium]